MSFPTAYIALEQQEYSNSSYKIVPIRYEDRGQIMKWRNEQLFHLRQNKPLTPEDQDFYFNEVVAKLFEQERPNQLLFSFLRNDELIGYGGLVHINWIDKHAEISFIMNTELEKNEFSLQWSNYLGLIEKLAFSELELHKIYTYAFDLRPHLYPVLEANGFKLEARYKEHCFFEGQFKDVLIHSKFNSYLTIKEVDLTDATMMYEWANDPITRSQSFSSNTIELPEHIAWLTRKLENSKNNYYIIKQQNNPCGIVRFDHDTANLYTIGITIAPEFRGKGLAAKCLKLACETFIFQNQFSKLFGINAFIKNENKASILAFEKAGFKLLGQTSVNDLPAFHYILNSNE